MHYEADVLGGLNSRIHRGYNDFSHGGPSEAALWAPRRYGRAGRARASRAQLQLLHSSITGILVRQIQLTIILTRRAFQD
jgi:hypothetical protein